MKALVSRAARPFALAWLLAACWPAAQALRLGEEAETARRFAAEGTVTAVDAAKRSLTVKGQRGQFTFRVDPKVANLDQVNPGEKVRVEYVAAIAMTLERGGSEAARRKAEAKAQARAQAGGNASAASVRPVTIVTTVLALDRNASSIRLKGPAGREVDFVVRDKADLSGVRVGDQIVAVVYEAVAVEVVPAAK